MGTQAQTRLRQKLLFTNCSSFHLGRQRGSEVSWRQMNFGARVETSSLNPSPQNRNAAPPPSHFGSNATSLQVKLSTKDATAAITRTRIRILPASCSVGRGRSTYLGKHNPTRKTRRSLVQSKPHYTQSPNPRAAPFTCSCQVRCLSFLPPFEDGELTVA